MSAIERLSNDYDYTPETHDYRAWWDHHLALIAAMEPAQWPESRHWTNQVGEANNNAILTESDVVAIRAAWASGEYSQGQLGNLFGVSSRTIHSVVQRQTWDHIA